MSLFLKHKTDEYENYNLSFSASNDQGKTLFIKRNDMVRVCPKDTIFLSEFWTISTRFTTPLNSTGDWRTLTRGYFGDHHILVENGTDILGCYDNYYSTGFHPSGFKMSTLSNGVHTLVAVGKNDITYFYIDGELKGASDFQSKNDIYTIGGHLDYQSFGSRLYDFRVYDTCLNLKEIQSLSLQKELIPEPKCENLKVWLKMDGNILLCEKDEKYPKFKPYPLKIQEIGIKMQKDKLGIDFKNAKHYIKSRPYEWKTIPLTNTGYTISCFFDTPFLKKKTWRSLTRGFKNDHHIIVHTNGELGLYENSCSKFHTTFFNVDNLKTGEHHVCTIAENNITTFYVDGVKVGKVDVQLMSDIFSIGNTYTGDQEFSTFIWNFQYLDYPITEKEVELIYHLNINTKVQDMIIEKFGKENLLEGKIDSQLLLNQEEFQLERSSFNDFEKMVNNKILSDIKFVFSNKKEIYAHKIILISRSKYFSKLFTSNMKDSQEKEILIDNESYETFYQFIYYLYTDKMPKNIDSLALFNLCNFYGCESACSLIQEDIINQDRLNETSALHFLDISIQLNLSKLRNYTLTWILLNIKQVFQSKEIENISDEAKNFIILASKNFPLPKRKK